jgi:hypothetical protein
MLIAKTRPAAEHPRAWDKDIDEDEGGTGRVCIIRRASDRVTCVYNNQGQPAQGIGVVEASHLEIAHTPAFG